MKATQGWLTIDGKFFEAETEAKLYEAEGQLKQVLGENGLTKHLEVIALIGACRYEISTYLKAVTDHETFIEASSKHSPDAASGASFETILDEQADRLKPMPSVRSRTRRTPIRDVREGDGS